MFANDINHKIEIEFASDAFSIKEELVQFIDSIRKFNTLHNESRMLRCIIHLAEGKRDLISHYINAALVDPRDIIFWAEYDKNGRRVHDFNLPFSESFEKQVILKNQIL